LVQGTNLRIEYNYHDRRACGYKWSRILFLLDGMVWFGWEWNGFSLASVDVV
jgi:hypothetical protein